jgi:putative ABC transport system ATP-binding protein
LLLCDEPTGALDSATGQQILQLLDQLNHEQNKTVVLITHNHTIAQIGHRIATIHDGRIVSVETNDHPTPAGQIEW